MIDETRDSREASESSERQSLPRRGFLGAAALTGVAFGAGGMVHAQQESADFEMVCSIPGWEGVAPEMIEGETNPTLSLEAGQGYVLTWENGDGTSHNFAIRDDSGENLFASEFMAEEGATQTVEFTATEEMAQYICENHPSTMVGDVEVTGGETETPTDPAETDTPEDTDTPEETEEPEEPDDGARNFTADLSGENEVPPVDTDASGQSTFEFSDDDEPRLEYDLTVEGPWNGCVTQAHIHQGAADENGPVVAFLFEADEPLADAEGTLAEDTLTADDLIGPMEGEDLDALLEEMRADNTYVNVHSTEHPAGEIRGQIEPED